MILKRENEEIHVCDFCLKRKYFSGLIFLKKNSYLIVCNDCIRQEFQIPQKFNSIRKFKWYEVLHQYKEKGYELVDDIKKR